MCNSQSLKWGILGTGWIASKFAQSLKYLPGVCLKAVASRSLESAQAFAQHMGAHHAYGSYEELVSQDDIDVVYVATPHIRHHADCSLALSAGKSVLCEKPFAMSAFEAREIFEVAKKQDLFCMEAMWMRFIPLIQQVHSLVRKGEIGEIKLLSADFGYPVPFDPSSRFFNPKLGGGTLLDRGVYPLSLAFLLLGKPVEISGQASMSTTGVDEQASIILRYDNGALATLSSTFITYGSNTATIIGTRGKIEIHAPFYYPENISLTHFPDTTIMQPPPKANLLNHTQNDIKSRFKSTRLFKQIRRFKPTSRKTITKVETGYGYHHQVAEVNHCLKLGLRESPMMPWEETIQIMEVIDFLQKKWS